MADPVQYLNSLPMFGSGEGFKPGLERVARLLDSTNYKEDNLKFIHVAGSNGKGSVIAMLDSIFSRAGFSVGRYISPHIIDFSERIKWAGKFISREELKSLVAEIRPLVEQQALWRDIGSPTFFEVVTAAALLYFSRKEPDLVLLETGLGGRLDATNVISSPVAAVITTIALEHTRYLGNTLAKIAREKAGIIKPDSLVITGEKKQEPLRVIEEVARDNRARIYYSSQFFQVNLREQSLGGQSFEFVSGTAESHFAELADIYCSRKLFLPLNGRYQLENARLACAITALLQEKFPVSDRAVAAGLAATSWPGRLEVVRSSPPVIIDGSHTPAGIKYLVEFLQDNFSRDKRITIILAVLRDKDLNKIIDVLDFRREKLKIILTSSKASRAFHPRDKAQNWSEKVTLKPDAYLWQLTKESLENQQEDEVLCLTGSLYNLLEIRNDLIKLIAEQ